MPEGSTAPVMSINSLDIGATCTKIGVTPAREVNDLTPD